MRTDILISAPFGNEEKLITIEGFIPKIGRILEVEGKPYRITKIFAQTSETGG